MITPNSKIVLLKTPMELDEANTLTFSTETAKYNYFNSLTKLELVKATYQRENGVVRYPTTSGTTYEDLIKYNYCMYQNTSYDSKWFYAFIENISYINDGMCEIKLKTDAFMTWQNDITYKASFIEREHVSDDTLGKHTIPEGLETGEYICNDHHTDTTLNGYLTDLCYIMASTSEPVAGEAKETVAPSGYYNGIYTGLTYYRYDASTALDTVLEIFAEDAKTDAINGIFMAPKWLATKSGDALNSVANSNSPVTTQVAITKPTTLNGYTPKNKKTLVYPYNYMIVSNNVGQNSVMHYEKFSTSNCVFLVRGVLNPGCSVSIVPTYYNGSLSSEIDSIMLGKYPTCNFQNDMYTNWLTANSVNILGNTVSRDDMSLGASLFGSLVGGLTSLATGNPLGIIGSFAAGGVAIGNSLMQKQQHDVIPNTVKGQLNGGDVNVAAGLNTFHFYKMSVKYEMAKVIDDYFTMYGYKVNSLEVINPHKRTYFDYIKTIGCNITGNIPQAELLEIKSLFDRGITLWHNTSHFLDYSVNNTIVS